ncbi:MAG: hypothetical protein U0575_05360 [Phycisphaerales bacterium]
MNLGTLCSSAIALAAGVAPLAFPATLATYNGNGGNTNWSNALNWTPPTVPLNGGVFDYDVVIPAGKSVVLDAAMPVLTFIDTLALDSTATLTINAQRSLQVTGAAQIGGLVNVSGVGSGLSASNPSGMLTGTQPRLLVSAGGTATAAGTSYTNTALFSAELLTASGAGSALSLPGVLSMTLRVLSGFGNEVNTIRADGGGSLDLGDVQAIILQGSNGSDRADFIVDSAGVLDLSSLAGATSLELGDVIRFDVRASNALSLPGLGSASGVEFLVAAGAAIQAPVLGLLDKSFVRLDGVGASFVTGGVPNIPDARFGAFNGAVLGAGVITATSWSATSYFNTELAHAAGGGSLIDLSTVASATFLVNSGFGAEVNTLIAETGGMIDLSGLQTVSLQPSNGADRLDFIAQTGGTFDLGALATITSTGGDDVVRLDARSGGNALSLPALTSATGVELFVGSGSSIATPVLGTFNHSFVRLDGAGASWLTGGVPNIPDARFGAFNGAALGSGMITATNWNATAYFNTELAHAAGAGSLLDLSTISSATFLVNSGFGTEVNSLIAETSGAVDLSGLQTITLQPSNGPDRVDVIAQTGGAFDLGSLATITSTGGDDYLRLDMRSGGIFLALPALTSATGAELFVGAGSSIIAPALGTLNHSFVRLDGLGASLLTGGVPNIPDARFGAFNGAALGSGAITATSWSATGYFNTELAHAAGAGSIIDLSTILSATFLVNSGFGTDVNSLIAENGGVVNLAGLQTITLQPSNGPDRVDFIAQAGGAFNLGSLKTISSPGGDDFVRFDIRNGSALSLPMLTNATGSQMVGSGTGSITAPLLNSYTHGLVQLTGPGASFVRGATLTSIDDALFYLFAGATLAPSTVSATSWTCNDFFGIELLRSSGAGSMLALPSLETVTIGNPSGFGTDVNTIRADAGGAIDLSGVETITLESTNGPDRLDVVIEGGGMIDLSALEAVTSLGADDAVRFDVRATGNALSLPSLAATDGVQFFVGSGSFVIAPALETLKRSFIRVDGLGATFDTSGIDTITDSIFGAFNGATLEGDVVSASTWSNTFFFNTELARASGSGSFLLLPSVVDAIFAVNSGFGAEVDSLRADLGGTIEMGGLETIVVNSTGGLDRVDVIAESGGVGGFGALRSVAVAGDETMRFVAQGTSSLLEIGPLRAIAGHVDLVAATGGMVTAGGFGGSATSTISVTGAGSTLDVACPFILGGGAGGNVFGAGNVITVRGSMSHTLVNETLLQASTAVFIFDGGGNATQWQRMEVAGVDSGPVNPRNNGNFGLGQLVVGDEMPTLLQLTDLVDNGNGDVEALYLFGVASSPVGSNNGLVLGSGSTLVIDQIPVYAFNGGAWVALQALFGPGQTCVPFGGGIVCRTLPGIDIYDLNGDGVVNGADLGLLLASWGDNSGGLCVRADIDINGVVDGADLGLLLANWG